jgi:SAM-dependent methyltransferase
VTTQQQGYQRPSLFSIVHCGTCGAAHALPLETSSAVYELIYERAHLLPGYDRYARYARDVKHAHDPLAYLSAREDVYWSIAQYFEARDPSKDGPVLEIGCGLGYLTYALRRRGFDATGIDVSTEAIARACERYGPFYAAGDVVELAAQTPSRFSVIVMAETIEHLPDFFEVMRAIAQLLRPGGEAVLTTPNRSFYAPELVWETDPPPVHLWWLTEDAMRRVADRVGMRIRFMDFGPYNRRLAPIPPEPPAPGPTRSAMLDERGRLLVRSAALRRYVPVGHIYDLYARARARLAAYKNRAASTPDPAGGRRGTMCTILTKS